MMDIEQQIRLDLEMALAQVRATIKAECRVTRVEFNHDAFTFQGEASIGEWLGLKDWAYSEGLGETRIPVQATRVEFNGDTLRYMKDKHEDIENYWEDFTETMVETFFHQNPAYQQAINA